MRRPAALLIALPFLLLARPAPSAAGCDPNAPPDCSCGKLPVCVFSGHPDAMYSDLYAKSDNPSAWQGFGEGESDYATAMQIESDMARALAAAYPCLDVMAIDSYMARIMLVSDEGETSGLQERMRQARAAGDTAALEESKKETDALFDKWGIGDLPWQDQDLLSAHMAGRLAGCISMVKLSGAATDGNYQVQATAVVPMGGALDDTQSSTDSPSPQGGVADLAKQVAGQLAAAHQKLFCSCQETVMHCTGENYEMGKQSHRCDYTRKCCGEVMTTWTERGEGIVARGSVERANTCCSKPALAREGQGDPEDKKLMDQIWCPGTWNLWGRDLDCDGTPNADDPTPWPPGHDE